ncbi:tripartite tricarboxylate transporter TctB family protein [Pacificibacter sp. AS14]|uniref:tripartite tricarboxylate transporter TctB family protein n=1 Tax=Pacificibacter sp. AS14 TaxID=3135785 RepID=UPI003181C81A
MNINKLSIEQRIVLAFFASAGLSVVFIGQLVAAPKLLFGRSLTAISPSLFPIIALSCLAILSAAFFAWRMKNPEPADKEPMNFGSMKRGAMFFGLMTFYGLLMEPIGFWISSALSLALMSWLVGNRSILQIVALSFTGPALLYLAATRLLAVSLPELNSIELFYAQVLGL